MACILSTEIALMVLSPNNFSFENAQHEGQTFKKSASLIKIEESSAEPPLCYCFSFAFVFTVAFVMSVVTVKTAAVLHACSVVNRQVRRHFL